VRQNAQSRPSSIRGRRLLARSRMRGRLRARCRPLACADVLRRVPLRARGHLRGGVLSCEEERPGRRSRKRDHVLTRRLRQALRELPEPEFARRVPRRYAGSWPRASRRPTYEFRSIWGEGASRRPSQIVRSRGRVRAAGPGPQRARARTRAQAPAGAKSRGQCNCVRLVRTARGATPLQQESCPNGSSAAHPASRPHAIAIGSARRLWSSRYRRVITVRPARIEVDRQALVAVL
jgi:hypothetical protein